MKRRGLDSLGVLPHRGNHRTRLLRCFKELEKSASKKVGPQVHNHKDLNSARNLREPKKHICPECLGKSLAQHTLIPGLEDSKQTAL